VGSPTCFNRFCVAAAELIRRLSLFAPKLNCALDKQYRRHLSPPDSAFCHPSPDSVYCTPMQTHQLSLFPYLETESAARPPDFIPIYEPWLGKREEQYVLDAVRSGWISSLGRYVTRFEQQFAAFCGVRHAVSVSNGTTALHLALHAVGIGPGDEVIVPALTFIASANGVSYTGATPVFADVDPTTWCIDPADVARLITPRTRAVMPVHLYGHPAPMDAINALAERHI